MAAVGLSILLCLVIMVAVVLGVDVPRSDL